MALPLVGYHRAAANDSAPPPVPAPPRSPASSQTPKRAGGPESFFFVKCCAPGILLQNALFCKEGPPGALYPFIPSPFPHCLRRKSGQLATVLLIHVFSGNSALWNFTKPTCSFFPCSCVFRECSFTPIVLTFHPMVISMHSSSVFALDAAQGLLSYTFALIHCFLSALGF